MCRLRATHTFQPLLSPPTFSFPHSLLPGFQDSPINWFFSLNVTEPSRVFRAHCVALHSLHSSSGISQPFGDQSSLWKWLTFPLLPPKSSQKIKNKNHEIVRIKFNKADFSSFFQKLRQSIITTSLIPLSQRI